MKFYFINVQKYILFTSDVIKKFTIFIYYDIMYLVNFK